MKKNLFILPPTRRMLSFSLLFLLLFSLVSCAPKESDPIPWAKNALVFTATYEEGGESYTCRFTLPKVGEDGEKSAVLLSPESLTGLSYIERDGVSYASLDGMELPLTSMPSPLVRLSALRPKDAVLSDVTVENDVRQVTLLSDTERYIFLYKTNEEYPYEVRKIGADGYFSLRNMQFE